MTTLTCPSDPVAAGFAVDVVRDETALAVIANQWDRLAGGVPFRHLAWLEPWWNICRPRNAELYVVIVRQFDQAVALAPWYLSRSVHGGRVLRLLGSGDVCTDYLTVFVDPAVGAPAIERLAEFLLSDDSIAFDAIEFEAVTRDDESIDALTQRLSTAGLSSTIRPTVSSWRIELPDTWDDYLKALSKSRRERVRQLWRRQFDDGRASVRWVERESELDGAMAILVELHQRRRQGMGDPGFFANATAQPFLREVAGRFLAENRLRLQIVELEGKPVAAEFDLVGDDSVYYFQSGVDPELLNERPGWLGNMAAIRRAIDEGSRYFDFLRGDEPYKQHWRAEPVPLVNVRIAGRGLVAAVRHTSWVAAHDARQKARRAWNRWKASRCEQS